MVIAVRRQLLRAVKALRDHGTPPPNVENQQLNRIRHATVVLPTGADWVRETEQLRDSEAGLPVAWEMKPLAETGLSPKLETAG
jgi:hypothetical protein